ncbi:hypothetical protein IM511_05055 [Erythrobacteraceae bacterium E2-1 Yellow Sea]|nr:hypothetical protein [Erythrobacteraceae bacterium E2-1 Yellow Sea]
MSGSATYPVPTGPLCLAGPIARPAPGTLPLRGDLAHIALAGTHLAAHYVVPHIRQIGGQGAALRLTPRDDSDTVVTLAPGTDFELLDVAGDWAWGCLGPDGPSGYVKGDCLTPASA